MWRSRPDGQWIAFGPTREGSRSLQDPPPSGMVAVALAWFRLGDPDEAFRWLMRAYEERASMMITFNAPYFDPLRSDRRFQDLLRRMNFPSER